MEKIKAFFDELLKWLIFFFIATAFLGVVGGLYYVDHLRFCH